MSVLSAISPNRVSPDSDVGDSATTQTRDRILSGATTCLGRWGYRKTTIPDVVRESGVSRATIYRYFPDGKSSLMAEVAEREEESLFGALAPLLETCTDLGDTLATAISSSLQWLRRNEMLSYLTTYEPEQLAPHLAFDAIGPIIERASVFLNPYVGRFISEGDAPKASEWAIRLVLSHWLEPSDHADPSNFNQASSLVANTLRISPSNPPSH